MIHCEKCDGRCCKEFDIIVTKAEYMDLLEIDGSIKTAKDFGEILVLPKPCPFFKDNRCSAYSKRPTFCRTFPYNMQKATDGGMGMQFIGMTIDPRCPRIIEDCAKETPESNIDRRIAVYNILSQENKIQAAFDKMGKKSVESYMKFAKLLEKETGYNYLFLNFFDAMSYMKLRRDVDHENWADLGITKEDVQ